VREIKKNGDILGQDAPLIEFKGRNISLGVNAPKIGTVLSQMRRKINLNALEWNALFFGDNVGRHGTGTRGIVEFHPALHREDGDPV
jgi:hypothetical protein